MKKIFFAISVFMFAVFAHATCQVPVHRLENVEKKIRWQDEDGSRDDTAVIRNDISGTLASDSSSGGTLDYEAFIRPDQDGTFQLLPIPLFVVALERAHDVVYLCSHLDSKNSSKDRTVIYFLWDGKIQPITPVPLPLTEIKDLLKGTPLGIFRKPIKLTDRIQEILVHIFGDITKIGVDRVVITDSQIELYSGGDPAQFDDAVLKKVIPLSDDSSAATNP